MLQPSSTKEFPQHSSFTEQNTLQGEYPYAIYQTLGHDLVAIVIYTKQNLQPAEIIELN